MIWDDRIDRRFIAEHTTGFDALKAIVRDMPPREAAPHLRRGAARPAAGGRVVRFVAGDAVAVLPGD